MKLLRVSIYFLVCCWISPVYAEGCSNKSAAEFVQWFYDTASPSAVPQTGELRNGLGPFSERLHALLVATAKYRDDFIEAHPAEISSDGEAPVTYKPPFVDGDPFKGPPDGASHFQISGVKSDSESMWQVRVDSLEEPGMSPWSVLVTVVRERGECALDEVLYEPYSDGFTLSKYLNTRY